MDDFDTTALQLLQTVALTESDLSDLTDLTESECEIPSDKRSLGVPAGGKHKRRNASKRQRKKLCADEDAPAVLASPLLTSNLRLSSGPKKRNRKKNQQRASRIEERGGHQPSTRTIQKAIRSAEFISATEFNMEADRPSAKGAYSAHVNAADPDKSKPYDLKDLLELGFQHI